VNSEAVCSRVNQIIPHIKHTFAVLRFNTEHMGDTIAIRQGSFKRADLCQHLLADRLNNKAGPDRFGGVELVENRDVVSLIASKLAAVSPPIPAPIMAMRMKFGPLIVCWSSVSVLHAYPARPVLAIGALYRRGRRAYKRVMTYCVILIIRII
jgi:hypothetical protein